MTTPDANDPDEPSTGRPIVFGSVSGPAPPDMDKVRERAHAQCEEDVRRAEDARPPSAGLAPRKVEPPEWPTLKPGEFLVRFDWRGETATYYEHDRSTTVAAIYWGGPKGSVSHHHRAWAYRDGRRMPMTAEEGKTVLARVAQRARIQHGFELEIRDA